MPRSTAFRWAIPKRNTGLTGDRPARGQPAKIRYLAPDVTIPPTPSTDFPSSTHLPLCFTEAGSRGPAGCGVVAEWPIAIVVGEVPLTTTDGLGGPALLRPRVRIPSAPQPTSPAVAVCQDGLGLVAPRRGTRARQSLGVQQLAVAAREPTAKIGWRPCDEPDAPTYCGSRWPNCRTDSTFHLALTKITLCAHLFSVWTAAVSVTGWARGGPPGLRRVV
jgi:hypothetical protein